MNMPVRALSGAAFATVLLVAFLMGANHVAARIAFNHGADVATGVLFRSGGTALVVLAIVLAQRVRTQATPRQKRVIAFIGLLIGCQSLLIYSAVARLPVALALLAFNTYPITGALWSWGLWNQRPERAIALAMPVILVGLALALDVLGAASGLGASGQWAHIGAGVAFALAASTVFGLTLALTQHEVAGVDGRVRTAASLFLAAAVAGVAILAQGGPHFPQDTVGWIGLASLTLFYGTAFTILFTVLPRLGIVGNSALMSVEPVFALVLAWLLLGQAIAPMQVVGALVVVGAVVALGLRKR
ncbi:MAG: EamA family transporter [Ramlibacter sp.]|jgi:drug/metabolite transporter (DMT)-like permease